MKSPLGCKRALGGMAPLKTRATDDGASAATDPSVGSAAAEIDAMAKPTSHRSPPRDSRKKHYVIFEGTASQALRTAFAERPDWRDASAAISRVAGTANDALAHNVAANARCHEALQRGSGHGISFCWRHMPPKQVDSTSVVVNRWRARLWHDRT